MSDKMDIDIPQICTNNHDKSPSSPHSAPSMTYASVAKSGNPSPNTPSSSINKFHIKGDDSNNKRKRRDKPYDKKQKPGPRISQDQFFGELYENTQGYLESYHNASDSNVDDNKGVAQPSINEKTADIAESSEVQPVFSRQRKSKGQSKSSDRNTINDDEQKLDDNSKLHSCQCHPRHELEIEPLIPVFPISSMDCFCDYTNRTLIDFHEVTSEDIPDKKEPIKPIVNRKRSIRLIPDFIISPLFKSFYGESGNESDSKATKNSKTAESSTCWGLNFFHSNSRDCASQSAAISNSNSYGSSSNNGLKDSLTKTSAAQYETPRSKPIRLLILQIAFGRQLNEPDNNKCHLKGYHMIVKSFENVGLAFQFVRDSIINCWANSWKVALIVSYDRMNDSMVHPFLKDIRDVFESDILDVILLKSTHLSSFHRCQYLEITMAEGKEINKVLSNVTTKAYRLNKYGENDILFYNKEEPYYEFTNFYRAQIKIDDENWPTTEHYFQAAKFHNKNIRNKIRLAYTAREAFTIARTNDYYKRKDWESPKPPDGMIFKEGIMKNALFEKFFQHIKLRHKLLSTGKAKIYEHTENDRYWGDGGRNHNGLNRLGTMLQELRNMLMDEEKQMLMYKYGSIRHNQKWVVTELQELQQFEDLIDLD